MKEKKIGGLFKLKKKMIQEQEWKGMPEFSLEKLSPFKTIYVHFRNQEDMEEFSKIMGQKIGLKTKWIWHPKSESMNLKNLRYVDSEELENES